MLVEGMLEDLECQVVHTAGSVPDAIEAVRTLAFDLAVLDVNLAGKQVFPVAEELAAKSIPFIISSGYGSSVVPDQFKAAPVIPKPFRIDDLEAAIATAVRAT